MKEGFSLVIFEGIGGCGVGVGFGSDEIEGSEDQFVEKGEGAFCFFTGRPQGDPAQTAATLALKKIKRWHLRSNREDASLGELLSCCGF